MGFQACAEVVGAAADAKGAANSGLCHRCLQLSLGLRVYLDGEPANGRRYAVLGSFSERYDIKMGHLQPF